MTEEQKDSLPRMWRIAALQDSLEGGNIKEGQRANVELVAPRDCAVGGFESRDKPKNSLRTFNQGCSSVLLLRTSDKYICPQCFISPERWTQVNLPPLKSVAHKLIDLMNWIRDDHSVRWPLIPSGASMEPLHSFLFTAFTLKLKFRHLSEELSWSLRAREEKTRHWIWSSPSIQSGIALKREFHV